MSDTPETAHPQNTDHDEISQAPHVPDPATEPGFGLLDESDAENNLVVPEGYQVLARKYRPRNFDDLIGQESMVRTLHNAFETGRIAHAFMLTGVRGVGKTTTARILARALNYQTDSQDAPQIDLNEMGIHCAEIMSGNHVDIIEMDAASTNGIDDIREIIESVRYRPAAARYKVFIIDEVHMLSTQAFNGLLKTLEEPPPHVKFIFATTEIRKVPVTVLSRCQRFDLRRLSQEETLLLLNKVCTGEAVSLPDESLALIARAAEGSARDALSLLDRALAHGGSVDSGSGDNGPATDAQLDTHLDAETIRQMLGLTDRNRVFDLFDLLMQGNLADALQEFEEQYRLGADPVTILADLSELTYWLTRLKYVPGAGDDIAVAEAQRVRGVAAAEALSVRILSRAWQVLLKGHGEAMTAPNPMAAAEMVLVRLAHLADMPSPEELLKQWDNAPAGNNAPAGGNAPAGENAQITPLNSPQGQVQEQVQGQVETASAAPGLAPLPVIVPENIPATTSADIPVPPRFDNFSQLVAYAGQMRDIKLKHLLETAVHLVRFEPPQGDRGGVIEYRLAEGAEDFSRHLTKSLRDWTGAQWMVSLSQSSGSDTLHQSAMDEAGQRRARAAQDPLVNTALQVFPGAEIVSVSDFNALDESGLPSNELTDDSDPTDEPGASKGDEGDTV